VGSIRVAWWNLENLFDTVDDPISRDFDFTPSEGWTATAYKAKKQNLAAALNELHGGLGPELLGVAEVEGDTVFEELIAETGNTHLKVVKDPSGTSDLRGIDVSLAYDDRKLSVVDKHSHVVHQRLQRRAVRHRRRRPSPSLERARSGDRPDERNHEVRERDGRLSRRRHLPLQRIVAVPRTREPRHLLYHLDPCRRGVPESLPGTPTRSFAPAACSNKPGSVTSRPDRASTSQAANEQVPGVVSSRALRQPVGGRMCL
jgi:Endonuclease/Exonuclease/phosphatase family